MKDAVSNVFDVLDVKPSFEVERIGKQQSGTIRPIIVKLRSAIAASGILRKTGKLKRNDSTKSVYSKSSLKVTPRWTLHLRIGFAKLTTGCTWVLENGFIWCSKHFSNTYKKN